PLGPQLACIFDELVTKRVFADRRLGLAEENDDVMLLIRIGPKKKPIARRLDVLNEAFLHLDLVNVEEIRGLELGNDMHFKFGQQIKPGIQGHMTHSWPYRDEPRVDEFQILGHCHPRFPPEYSSRGA